MEQTGDDERGHFCRLAEESCETVHPLTRVGRIEENSEQRRQYPPHGEFC
jgi:hypothetical protein